MSPPPLRTYGRTKARALKPRQAALVDTLLPHLALPAEGAIEIDDLFPSPWRGEGLGVRVGAANANASPHPPAPSPSRGGGVGLEIGFGGGEHLVAQAAAHPGARFIGVEPFLNGVASCLRHIEEQLLPLEGEKGDRDGLRAPPQEASPQRSRAAPPQSSLRDDSSPIEGERARRLNIRLHHGDARDVIARLPEASLDMVYILFPDPWPKARHHKRRLIQPEFLDALARVLKPSGEVRFATDWANYAEWTLEHFVRDARFMWTAERAEDWRKPWPGHVTTRYEAKRLGDCAPVWLRFVRR